MDAQQASLELMRLINGYQVSQVIHVAASFGIADLLKDGPRLSAEIAEATGTHARSMHRLLRALASAGVLEEQPDSRFSLTISANVCGRILRTRGSPGPVRTDALTLGKRGGSCGTA